MKFSFLIIAFIFPVIFLQAQKKPLDHTVYDGWESLGEKTLSHDGKWVMYAINVQEGDNQLQIKSVEPGYSRVIPRGYAATFSMDGKFAVFRIRPYYKDTREARIKKKKPDEMPKDSLGILDLEKDSLYKVAAVKSYRFPEKSPAYLAYHLDKKEEKARTAAPADRRIDSLQRTIDSLRRLLAAPGEGKKKKKNRDGEEEIWEEEMEDALNTDPLFQPVPEGTILVVREMATGKEQRYPLVSEYHFTKDGKKLVMETTRGGRDSVARGAVTVLETTWWRLDTISRGGNDFRNFTWSEDGGQLAFLAEREARPNDLQRNFRLWYYKSGMDSASLLVDKNSVGMQLGMTVSEHGQTSFSKSGKRLFFGVAPITPPRDTTLIDLDAVKLDIWHYQEDYLQTVQLSRLSRDQQENFLSVYDLSANTMQQLASREIPTIYQAGDGDADYFAGVTDFGKRVESQWTGNTRKDIYRIHVKDGKATPVVKNLHGIFTSSFVSPGGKYIMWYDREARNYIVFNGQEARNISANIPEPVWNQEYDLPDEPTPYGILKWKEGDDAVFIYTKYSVWRVDPRGIADPETFLEGKSANTSYRYIQTDPEEKALRPGQKLLFRLFNEETKESGLVHYNWTSNHPEAIVIEPVSPVYIGSPSAARDEAVYAYSRESYQQSPDLYVAVVKEQSTATAENVKVERARLTQTNPQQAAYNWGTAELVSWKAYSGKEVQGILYKPEDFDPKKKYPLIAYFYERLSDGLYQYVPPTPTPSRLNISFFVSRGYLVFAPDIHYTTGHPARDAYNHVVSGVRALVKRGYVDSTRLGLQGQSWGGIQVVQIITQTPLFAAAWAGAPVANMTSAYGGIRWESGANRQFQYEKSQSRIGATLWERPDLYIENSPLFHLPAVRTPLVIMHNDADGAVPWYQGIELFTGLRRLGKPAWLLNYNGEAHNLVERKNRKDIQVRQQQFFDWLLKGEKAPRWIREGVPALRKGQDWGFEIPATE